jgi:hypothetical protein
MHLPEVRRELRLLVPPTGHVLMGLTPGLEHTGDLALDGGSRRSSAPVTALLLEDEAAQFHLPLRDLVGLRCRDGCQEPLG